MAIAWTEPITQHSPLAPGDHPQKVAAVNMDTDEIVKIYTTTVDAARHLLYGQYFPFTPSMRLIQEVAKEIANAASHYHQECIGFYWKWIH